MANWLIPALKAVLPHVGTIVSAAAPAFTRRKADAAAEQAQLMQQQIAELQSAAAQNSAFIKELAEQLQRLASGVEQAAAIAEGRLRRAQRLVLAAAGLSVIAVALALWTLLKS